MDIKIKWIADDSYIQAYWCDFIDCRSKYRKWSLHFAFSLIVVGVLYFILGPNMNSPLIISTIFIVSGVLVAFWHFWDKHKWFNVLRKSKSFGKENIVQFTNNKILVSGPTSKGEITWEGIDGIELSKNGAFVILQKGLSIYLPKFSDDKANNLNKILEYYSKLNA